MNTPDCPVCGIKLRQTNNPELYQCPRRTIWVPELGCYMESVHSTVYMTQEGKITHQVIEIIPYTFNITDDGDIQRTEVRKVMENKKAPWKDNCITDNYGDECSFRKELVLDIKAVLKFPWHERSKVMDRMKVYLLFS